MAGKRVMPTRGGAAGRVAEGMATHEHLMQQKNASWGRWVGGWPIVQSALGVATSIASALTPIVAGQVDLFAQALAANSNNANPLLGSFPVGQAPWNNFLGTNQRPFNKIYPQAGGIYWGQIWDSVSGATQVMTHWLAQFVENSIFVLYKNQNPEGYFPAIMNPAGVRIDARISTTVDNVTLTTEGLGALDGRGQKKFRDDEYWSPAVQLGMQWQRTASLAGFIASLTTQNIPQSGTLIAWMGHGVELRRIVTGA